MRWRIYNKIRFKKKRLKRTMDYYRKQVNLFLAQFSMKLKPKETSIWSEKLAKTSKDVLAFLNDAKKVGKVNIKAQPCFECSNKLDSVLFMLSTVLYLVKTEQAKAATEKEAAKTTIDAVEQSVEPSGDYAEESKCNIGGIITPAREVAEAPTDEHKEAIVDDALLDRNPETKGLRNSVYNDREEHMRRIREASDKYLASCVEGTPKLGNSCPPSTPKGLAISDEAREKAWAIYYQPSKQKNPFHVPVTREEVLAFDEGRSSKW